MRAVAAIVRMRLMEVDCQFSEPDRIPAVPVGLQEGPGRREIQERERLQGSLFVRLWEEEVQWACRRR